MELKIFTQGGVLKLTVSPSVSSTWNSELMVENAVSVSFTHPVYVQLEVNDYITLEGTKFAIQKQYKPKQKNEQEYTYNAKFYGPEHDAQRVKYLNLTDGQYDPQFSLDGSPREHLQKVVDNLNRIYGEDKWSIGEVITAPNQNIEYNNMWCWDALAAQAEAFETEWWADGYTLNLCRCERGERVSLGYQQGLTQLIQSENSNDVEFFTRLIPLGSTKNIDFNRYGYTRLQLPNRAKFVDLNTDVYGIYDHVEEAAFEKIFPHYTGTISEVRSAEKTGENGKTYTVYYFKDNGMSFNPNDSEISGLVKHLSFQSGDLNGRDFEANYSTANKEWEIINTYPSETVQIPGGNLIPRIGDTYIPWNFRMPVEYETQAEQDYQAAVTDFLSKYSFDTSKYGGDTDYIYVTENAVPLILGQSVRLLSNKYFGSTGYLDTRMTKVVHRLENLNMSTIECTNDVGKGWKTSVDSDLTQLQYIVAQQQAEIVLDILKSWDGRESTDYRVMSALRVLNEITNRSLSRVLPDKAAEIIDFLKGLTINGDKATIDKDGIATVQQLIALVKAQVAALEVTGNTKTNSLNVTNTAKAKDVEATNNVTTLNAVIQALAKTHDLTVENTADIMHGIIREYLTSDSFVSGFLGSGFKIWKDENGLWHGEFDELTVRKTFLPTSQTVGSIFLN